MKHGEILAKDDEGLAAFPANSLESSFEVCSVAQPILLDRHPERTGSRLRLRTCIALLGSSGL